MISGSSQFRIRTLHQNIYWAGGEGSNDDGAKDMIYASDGAVVIKYQIAFASSGLFDFGNSTTLIT
eukprot:7665545-Ditylum_brightwellii.AAC.1